MSPRLPVESKSKKKARNEGTYLAMIFMVLCIVGLISLTSMILPQIQGILFVAVGFSGFIALHYFTWGRWLMRVVEKQAKEEAE